MLYDELEGTVEKRPVETATVTSGLPVVAVSFTHFMNLHEEGLVAGILDLQQVKWLVVANER